MNTYTQVYLLVFRPPTVKDNKRHPLTGPLTLMDLDMKIFVAPICFLKFKKRTPKIQE